MASAALVFSEEGLRHDTGPRHPECPDRLRAIQAAFHDAMLNPPRLKPKPAAQEDLLRIHTAEHIENVRSCSAGETYYGDADTPMMEASYDVALLAAGAAIEACRAVLDGEYARVFSAMRPPGHHAERNRAMGFCLFNNVAVAAAWLREVRGAGKVAIVDWDVHHGNGTQHAFYNDPTVYYVSLHQFPHYPGTGRPEERGAENTNLNLTLPPGAPAEAWMKAFHEKAIPELERFNPDFLLISAGFDAHRADPLGDQNLEAVHFAEMTEALLPMAGGRLVSLLEGGYNLRALGQCAVAHFKAMTG